jgi:hypothetical protein
MTESFFLPTIHVKIVDFYVYVVRRSSIDVLPSLLILPWWTA